MAILNDAGDCAEVENDVLLKAWNTIPPQNPRSLRAYLGMLSRQLAIDRWRGRKGEFALSLEELGEAIPTTDRAVEQLDLRDALNEFLKSLPRKDRRIFLQRYWYACPIAQIAAEAGLREGAVKMRLSRMRERLRKFLEGKELL